MGNLYFLPLIFSYCHNLYCVNSSVTSVSELARFSSAYNRVFPLCPQELHQHTVMPELHPLAAIQSEPAHQIRTRLSSPRPGGRHSGRLRSASAPSSAPAGVPAGSATAGRGPLPGRQPEQLRQLVRGQRPRGAPRRLPLAHGTAETFSGRAAQPVRQAHASVRGLGLVIARPVLAFLCGDFTLVLLYLFLRSVSATSSIKIDIYIR